MSPLFHSIDEIKIWSRVTLFITYWFCCNWPNMSFKRLCFPLFFLWFYSCNTLQSGSFFARLWLVFQQLDGSSSCEGEILHNDDISYQEQFLSWVDFVSQGALLICLQYCLLCHLLCVHLSHLFGNLITFLVMCILGLLRLSFVNDLTIHLS